MTFSPYPVRDTFALVSVGDMSGIKLSTPSGPVWTDWQGQAVVPQVNAYGRSPVEVQTRSLPRNADINNGLAMITAGRGAVDRVEFGVALDPPRAAHRTHRAGCNRCRAARWSSTAEGEFITLVQDGSQVFLPNVLEHTTLWVSNAEHRRCRTALRPADQARPHGVFRNRRRPLPYPWRMTDAHPVESPACCRSSVQLRPGRG